VSSYPTSKVAFLGSRESGDTEGGKSGNGSTDSAELLECHFEGGMQLKAEVVKRRQSEPEGARSEAF